MRSLLDTSAWLAPPTQPVAGRLFISAVTFAELQAGVRLATTVAESARRRQHLGAIQRTYRPLPVDADVSASYCEIAKLTVRVGRERRKRCMDLLIAATAHAHGLRLVTRDMADFDHLSDILEIVDAT